MPIVGKGVPSQFVLYHQGSLPGSLSTVTLLPNIKPAIVVMTKSLALNDCSDWVNQLVLEELLQVSEAQRNNYVNASKTSAANTLNWYPSVRDELEKAKINDTSSKNLESYIGVYWNSVRTTKIVVTMEDEELYWDVQGLPTEKYVLTHCENDTFTWLQPRNYLVQRGRWVGEGESYWKVAFKENDGGEIDRLAWVHDPETIEGEEFVKRSDS